MKILINVGHPAHVHLFKNAIKILEQKGHEIKIAAVDKEITLYLLNIYGFNYSKIGTNKSSIIKKALSLFEKEYNLYKIAKKFNPDLLVSTGSPYAAHVSKLMNRPHIAFGDTESAKITSFLIQPFTDVICTPSCFNVDFGSKQVRYNGYHELAYLHPSYFKPDPTVLDKLSLGSKDEFIIIRISSKSSSHDLKDKGLSFRNEREILEIIKKFEVYGKVFLTSEKQLSRESDKYKLTIPQEQLHSLLSFSTLYFGDGAKMAGEAGVLGVPSIYVSKTRRGYLDDLEKYGLVNIFTESGPAVKKAIELLENKNIKDIYLKRKKLLNDKIDVTKFIVDFILNYQV